MKLSDTDYSVEEVEMIDQHLFKRLEEEKKARYNWRKVMTMVQLVNGLSKMEVNNNNEDFEEV